MTLPFRHTAGFGKRIEYWIVGNMLKEGLDVYLPLVDDDGIDGIIRRPDGTFTEFQIKSRSKDVVWGDSGLFAAITHEIRNNYWFIFYSERMETMWIMTSDEFVAEAVQNKNGKNVGKRSVWFNGRRKNPITKQPEEYVKDRYMKYVATSFDRLKEANQMLLPTSTVVTPAASAPAAPTAAAADL